MSDIKKIREEYLIKLNSELSNDGLNKIKTELFGKNGLISNLFKNLGSIPVDDRKKYASDINSIKEELQEKLDTSGIANAFLNNTSDLSDHKLLKNENAFINNEYVCLAALPIKTSSKLSIKVPSIDENGKKLRSEFN